MACLYAGVLYPVYLDLALILFLSAALTDYFDGYYARKYNKQSAFGAFLDPLADKLLVWGLLVVFATMRFIPWAPLFLMIIRDIFVTGARIFSGGAFRTSFSAKLKTALQFIVISGMILFLKYYGALALEQREILVQVCTGLIWFLTALSYSSAFSYISVLQKR